MNMSRREETARKAAVLPQSNMLPNPKRWDSSKNCGLIRCTSEIVLDQRLLVSATSTTDLFASDDTKITFGDVWVLRCGHMVDTLCAFGLIELRRRVSLNARPAGLPPPASPIAKSWQCPAPNCPTLYRSVRSCGIWTVLPDETGIVQDLKPFAREYSSSDPGLWPDVPRGTLSDLDAMGMSLRDLLAANDAYLRPESAARPLAVEYTTSFVQNSYIIDEIVAETLVSRPALPPNCTVDDDEGREPSRALVLVASKRSRNQWYTIFQTLTLKKKFLVRLD
ncbi:hypothetical protein EDD18DRAFT_1100688 [Armillaria luteobubalina]|uniref:Uncharacterized protein n=1 Tax=Armillaria luteobubalina TaxID=153913 RepID=A0AA39QG02_9AGAR|nr:hypothetical protein EDD18DRAFT_1100688 [Armillaria luteobubalina]